MMSRYEPRYLLDLTSCLGGAAEWQIGFGLQLHLAKAVGRSVAQEIEAPHMIARGGQVVAPRPAVEAMRDRKRGRKSRAVNVEYHPGTPGGRERGKIPEEYLAGIDSARNSKVLFPRIELGSGRRLDGLGRGWVIHVLRSCQWRPALYMYQFNL